MSGAARRVTYTIWNRSRPSGGGYVGHYTGWSGIPKSVIEAEATAYERLAGLRAEWPEDHFELTREER